MHEVAAMQGIVNAVLECMREAGADRVTCVELELSVSSHFTEEAARQHFAVLARGTASEGAELSLVWLPATYRCFTCLCRFESLSPPLEALCPECGGPALAIGHQDVCVVRAIEVATRASTDLSDDAPLGDLASEPDSTRR